MLRLFIVKVSVLGYFPLHTILTDRLTFRLSQKVRPIYLKWLTVWNDTNI